MKWTSTEYVLFVGKTMDVPTMKTAGVLKRLFQREYLNYCLRIRRERLVSANLVWKSIRKHII